MTPMRRSRQPLRLSLSLVLPLVLACSGDRGGPRSRQPSLLSAISGSVSTRSPAAFRYHPRSAAPMHARLALQPGQWLLAGQRGERWKTGDKTPLEAAAQLAPEALIAIQPLPSGGFGFVGRSGTVYEAEAPLGPLLRATPPLEPLVRVTASEHASVGIRRDGTLARSRDGAVFWERVGPVDVRFADVALGADGLGLAVSIPERWWTSRDGGAHWQAAELPSVGPSRLSVGRSGSVIAHGALGDVAYRAGASGWTRERAELQPARYELPREPPRGPDAGALARGTAMIAGGRYAELVLDEAKRSREYLLLEGPLDGALATRPLSVLSGCTDTQIAGFGPFWYLACLRDGQAATSRVAFFRSTDGGRSFEREPYTAMAQRSAFRMTVGREGALLVSGICPAHETRRYCLVRGVHHRRPVRSGSRAAGKDARGGAYELGPSALPGLGTAALDVTFGVDGVHAYAVGRRNKDWEPALFVSSDGGRTFRARDLEIVPEDFRKSPHAAHQDRATARELLTVTLTAADDGSVSAVFTQASGSVLLVAHADGQLLGVSSPPGDGSLVGAVGARALAVSVAERAVWETQDGGTTYQPAGKLPIDLCPGDPGCNVPVVCAPAGCVLGHELTRLGWGVPAEPSDWLGPPLEGAAPRLRAAGLRTPLSCSLDAAPWQDLPEAWGPPGADQAAIGETTWFTVASDDARRTALLVEARAGKPRVESIPLLPPVTEPRRYALAVSAQVEGAAALRYEPPVAGQPGEVRLRNVEVAWVNLFEGRRARARLPEGRPFRSQDYERRADGFARARPDLISITSGGLYLRIHRGEPGQPTLFFDGQGVHELGALEWPKLATGKHHLEIAHVGGAHVPFALSASGSVVARSARTDAGFTFDAFAVGFEEPGEFGLAQHRDITYVGERPSIHVAWFDAAAREQRGLVFPLRASGPVFDPPLAAPLQSDSADPPAACDADQRASAPRVVVPFQSGTRHAVVITDAVEPLRLLVTSSAVMHGSPERACVAALDAEVVKTEIGAEPQGERAVLPLTDLAHSYLFRVLRNSQTRQETLQYRGMSCRFDAAAEVPAEAYRVPGAGLGARAAPEVSSP